MLKKLQAGTGALFALFVVVHLINTWIAALGPEAYDAVQQGLRWIYQAAPVEALLLAALAVHVVIGLIRIFTEPKRTLSPRARWHRYAGLFLAFFITGHVLAVRGPSWFYDVYPGFEGLAFSIDYMPLYFYPYYFLLGLAGFYHAAHGLSVALPRLGLRLGVKQGLAIPVSTQMLKGATTLAAVLMLLALLRLHGVWGDVGAPYESGFAQLAAELLGLSYQ